MAHLPAAAALRSVASCERVDGSIARILELRKGAPVILTPPASPADWLPSSWEMDEVLEKYGGLRMVTTASRVGLTLEQFWHGNHSLTLKAHDQLFNQVRHSKPSRLQAACHA